MDAAHEPYRRLVESSPDGIFVSHNTRIVFVNPAGVRLTGASSADQVLGRNPVDLFDSESRARLAVCFADFAAHKAFPTTEATLARPDGTGTIVDVTCIPLADGGDSVQIIVRDVAERKAAEAALRESEERLTLAFTGAQEGVWDWDLETGAVVYSPRWKQMLGYADEEIEPHVRAWEHLLHPEDKPRANELNQSVIEGGRQTYEGEFRLLHKAGHYIHVLSRGFPVRREAGGPVVRIVGTHFDLTERRRVEAERARTELLRRLVFAQEDERRRIAREMHDQFGEHLTALGLGIAALKEACAGQPELRERVATIDGIAQRLDSDVDHLVWALRPTALDDLGLRAALANYVQDWSTRAGTIGEFHTVGLLDHRLSSEVETTFYRIAQEALTNIAKHAKAARVEVILERRPDSVLLIIEDDGVGFDPESAGTRGRGFGLLGMQERAALVGATLQIESEIGRGTTIFVRMPAPGGSSDNA